VRQRGSILIDQLVALALLGLLLVGVFSLLTTGNLAAQLVRQSGLAGGLAAQKLEEILDNPEEPQAVPRQAVDPVRFPRLEWEASVTDVDGLFRQVSVTVWWPLRTTRRSVTLTSLVRRRD
jgi:hypothetical protein